MTTDRSGTGPDDLSGDRSHGGTPEPLAPADEVRVSRMLREQAPPPLPPDVARRLDSRLEALVAERAGGAASGRPADSARPRRRWPQALLAAAAVLVGGYAVGTSVLGSPSGSDAMSADSRAAGAASSAPKSVPESADEALTGGGLTLRSAHLRRDVRRLLRSPDLRPENLAGTGRGCPGPPIAGGERSWRVRFDGTRAVLVAGRVPGGRVQVTVWSCAAEPLASTTVPAP